MSRSYIVLKSSNYSDVEEIKNSIITNASFQKIWFNLANILGFKNTKGYRGKYVGDDIKVYRDDDNYILQGISSSDKNYNTKITFSNFKFNFLSDSLSTEPVILNELEPTVVGVADFTNDTNETAKISKKILFSTLSTTSISSSHKIATDFAVSYDYEIKLPGATETTSVSYNFSHESTFENQADKIESKEYSDSITIDIPPKNKVSIKLFNHNRKVTMPFKGLAIISFNVTISGFMLKFSKAGVYRKKIQSTRYFDFGEQVPQYGYVSYTFGNDDLSAIQDIKNQIQRKDLPNDPDWEWTKALAKNKNYLLKNLDKLYQEFACEIKGSIDKVEANNVTIEIGPFIAL